MDLEALPLKAFKSLAIALSGVVDYETYTKFRAQFDKASDNSLVVIELSTLGGDPEVARMMGEEFASRARWNLNGALFFLERPRFLPRARRS